jgi:hypothetical protein
MIDALKAAAKPATGDPRMFVAGVGNRADRHASTFAFTVTLVRTLGGMIS